VAGERDQHETGHQPGPALTDEDAELILEFVQEAAQHFSLAESALLTLEKTPEDREAIGVVFRAFHTVKGVASLLGLTLVSEFAHIAESFLNPVRDGAVRFDAEYAGLSLEAIDMLRVLMENVARGRGQAEAPPGYADVTSRLASGASPRRDPPVTKLVLDPIPPLAALLSPSAAGDASLRPARSVIAAPAPSRRPGRAKSKPAGKGKGDDHPKGASRTEEAWIRIRADRLDALLDMVGELVIAQSMVTEDPILYESRLRDLQNKVNHCAKIARGLQDLSLSLRMVPLRATFQKMGRVVRDTAQRSQKQAELSTNGDETEVDRKLADIIADPLVHMVRNAVDHGIEPADERLGKGKPALGNLLLCARHSGGNVIIELSDDGRGLRRDKIVEKAQRQGLLAPDARLADQEIYNLIFSPGFSTNETVTDISGRGVGMDVVKRAIESLSGRIEIDSREGHGTRFSIHLPLTLAITDGMLVSVGAERHIIPTSNIQISFRPEPPQVKTLSGRGEIVMRRGVAIPMLRVHRAFNIPNAQEDPTRALVVVVTSDNGSRALLVDDLLGKHQVVTKGLGAIVGTVPGISGGAILGDGRIGLVIDPPGLIRLAEAAPRGSLSYPPSMPPPAPLPGARLGGKHLTFMLDREEYGIPISQVQEIVRVLDVAPVPNAAPYLRGVANLRGRILPVIDLRMKLGMSAAHSSEETRVIVITSSLGFLGMVVDRVCEVEEIHPDSIGRTPATTRGTEFVLGVGITGDRAQFLLDVGRIVNGQPLGDNAAARN
jgi:two-component system chemotaxis sensor kinase CheA